MHPALAEVLDSAARLQQLVPDAVLVGGSAAAYYARHRLSYDHDHVLSSLRDRFELVFDALDREGDFVLARAVPDKIILGDLGGIEVGVRQLIRKRPLEVQQIRLPSGNQLTVPTEAEILRIKSYLIVKRNQVRDYLDVAALSGRYGSDQAAKWLADIDEYYTDDTAPEGSQPVLTQLLRQLADPKPKDSRTTRDLPNYKGLTKQWSSWERVQEECQILAEAITSEAERQR
jgi:hypothetical protein